MENNIEDNSPDSSETPYSPTEIFYRISENELETPTPIETKDIVLDTPIDNNENFELNEKDKLNDKSNDKSNEHNEHNENNENNNQQNNSSKRNSKQKVKDIPPLETSWFYIIFFPLQCLFSWMTIPILKGIFWQPELNTLPRLPKKLTAEQSYKRMSKIWKIYKNWPRPLFFASLHLVWFEYSLSAIFNLLMRILDLGFPLLLSEMLKILISGQDIWKGYIYAVAIGLLKFFWSITMQMYNHYSVRSGMIVRAGLIGLLYEKSLKMKRKREDVMTLISVDATRIDMAFQFFHFSWTSVVQIIASMAFLAFLVGWSTFAAVVVIVLSIPVQFIIGRLTTIYQSKGLKFTDIRVKIINEIVSGIQLMKFYAWENEYTKRVEDARKNEISQVRRTTVLKAINVAIMSIIPVFISCATFAMYALLGGRLEVEIVFPAISYFDLMRIPLSYFPVIVNLVVVANVSMKRMENYLMEKELSEEDNVFEDDQPNTNTKKDISNIESKPRLPENIVAQFLDATFEWSKHDNLDKKAKHSKRRTLFKSSSKLDIDDADSSQEISKIENINLTIEKGKLVLVVGEVGSGKSSLISSILGEMQRLSGSLRLRGSLSYVPQAAFLRNATIRDNILFNFPMDEQKYKNSIYYSGLTTDLEQLNGDSTEVGARGVNLSGGQKTRICLARALFSDGDIYILDDCLSALDASVGKFIFNECVCGYLNKKTRIMVTHQLHFCEKADYIVVMDHGHIAEQGTYDELMKIEGGMLRDLIETHVLVEEHDDHEGEKVKKVETVKKQETKQQAEGPSKQGSTIIQKEERKSGRIKFAVFNAYAKAMGGWGWVLWLFILLTVGQIFMTAPDVWITLWSGRTIESLKDNHAVNLIIYASIGVCAGFIFIVRDLFFFLVLLRGSKKLHKRAFERIIRAPMMWFEAQPMARIISRFSGDIDLLDGELISNMSSTSIFGFQVIAVCIVIGVTTSGIFVLPLVIITIMYWILSEMYLKSSREFKRLDSIARSPMMSLFSETINGLSSIRAYRMQDKFFCEQLKRLTKNLEAYYMMQGCTRWLGIRLDVLGGILIFLISICSFLIRDQSFIDPNLLALGITYSLQFNRVMSWFIRNAGLTEVNLNAVERLAHYGSREIPNEARLRVYDENKPPKGWPQKGEIILEDIHFKYRPELEDTLKGISLKIGSEQKVAIVGRTGSGKSSTILSLFRDRELSSGKIIIDNIDISNIGLHDLREQLTIIPQTPTCFYGTVRSNLDPFGKQKDFDLWHVLEVTHLKPLIEKMGGLDSIIEEGGSNLSIGERSLLVLARALLRKRKILISDEASAAMDLSLDSKIQETIRNEFKDCTTITIAHRINTIIDSDLIVVLDAGKIQEIGSPKQLLQNTNSIFFRMVHDTGDTNQKKLLQMALGEDFDTLYAKFQNEGTL